MSASNKYNIPETENQSDILPNKLGITTIREIEDEELVGFAKAEIIALTELNEDTRFDLNYLYKLHYNAMGHLYDFAGKLRTVNMSKENFFFPAANFLSESMEQFEKDFLKPINQKEFKNNELILHLAQMHAELLYIHPFREGNGRTIRLFTTLIYFFKTNKRLDFEYLVKIKPLLYIRAVQQASQKEYGLMEHLFTQMKSTL